MSHYKSSTIDETDNIPIVKPSYLAAPIPISSSVDKLIHDLQLIKHPEGGYFKETFRSQYITQNPYFGKSDHQIEQEKSSRSNVPLYHNANVDDTDRNSIRSYSTLIYYLITSESCLGRLHRNHSDIIHIAQRGRGQYVIIYPNGEIKSFIVGFNFAEGEVAQWVVPGGCYKASFLLPESGAHEASANDQLLISEVVVPGFDFTDHRFMENKGELEQLVGGERADEYQFLLGDAARN